MSPSSPTLPLAMRAFLTRFSGRTQDSYRTGLTVFDRWCRDHSVSLAEVKGLHLDLFKAEMLARLKESTFAGYQGYIINFYEYLVENDEIDESPVPPGWRVKYRYTGQGR
jgi:site-specific recombinase XerD